MWAFWGFNIERTGRVCLLVQRQAFCAVVVHSLKYLCIAFLFPLFLSFPGFFFFCVTSFFCPFCFWRLSACLFTSCWPWNVLSTEYCSCKLYFRWLRFVLACSLVWLKTLARLSHLRFGDKRDIMLGSLRLAAVLPVLLGLMSQCVAQANGSGSGSGLAAVVTQLPACAVGSISILVAVRLRFVIATSYLDSDRFCLRNSNPARFLNPNFQFPCIFHSHT
jgi:hypothetical protein